MRKSPADVVQPVIKKGPARALSELRVPTWITHKGDPGKPNAWPQGSQGGNGTNVLKRR
jgi:hypothetical protein